MSTTTEILTGLESELQSGVAPSSIKELSERLDSLSIGLNRQIPWFVFDTRMFRVRRMVSKPLVIDEVGAPPEDKSPIGRLNDERQSVLYLADSPDTAFAESRVTAGEFCLSEWRVDVPKLAMAHGGIPSDILAQRFEGAELRSHQQEFDHHILNLFRQIYILDVHKDPYLYRWSIACGLVNGFSHKFERTDTKEINGQTEWNGRYPFAAIAYPRVRKNLESLNYALNDYGMTKVRLDNLQWVRRRDDGSYNSLDFANSWDSEGLIIWQKRPARFQLEQGESATVTKITETEWKYETANGSIPWFS